MSQEPSPAERLKEIADKIRYYTHGGSVARRLADEIDEQVKRWMEADEAFDVLFRTGIYQGRAESPYEGRFRRRHGSAGGEVGSDTPETLRSEP